MKTENNSSCCTSSSEYSQQIGKLALRLLVGGFMLTHGLPKLQNFEDLSTVFPDPLGVGSSLSLGMIVFAEVVCSILLILGLFTRLASIPLIIGMAVAAFLIHANDPFNVKEMALLYMGIYVVIALIGAGKYSVDYLLRNQYAKICSSYCKPKAEKKE
jgi:putative oxidoreductase